MTCTHCNDTGSLSKELHGYLDCTKCDAASERTQLEHWAKCNIEDNVSDVSLWAIYQHGKQSAKAVPA